MKKNYKEIMELAPNCDNSARYTVVAFPQDGGNPVIKKTDDRSYAIRLFKQAVAFNGYGVFEDSDTGKCIRVPPFNAHCSTKHVPVQQRGFYRPTTYGWLVVLSDGRRIEVATDQEAREILGL